MKQDNPTYDFYSVKEARKHNKSDKTWQSIVNDFAKYKDHIWQGKINTSSEAPVKSLKIIGIEDDREYLDYYWILEDNDGFITYMLVNDPEFYKNII